MGRSARARRVRAGLPPPFAIVQADSFNQSRIRTVLGVTLTSNLRLAEAPGNVLLPARQTGLPKDCVANVSQIVTLNKDAFTEHAGIVPPRLLERIETGLRLVLDL